MKKVISVRFKDNGKTYYFDPADTPIKTGDYVIVETARGVECGEVVHGLDSHDKLWYPVVTARLVKSNQSSSDSPQRDACNSL